MADSGWGCKSNGANPRWGCKSNFDGAVSPMGRCVHTKWGAQYRGAVSPASRDRRRAKFTSCVGLFAWRVASGRHILVAFTVNTRYLHFVLKVECRNDISLTGKWLVSDTGISIIR